MQRRDIHAVGELAVEACSVLTSLVQGVHAGIAGAARATGAAAAELWGDDSHDSLESRTDHQLAVHGNKFAGGMEIRHRGEPVPATVEALAAAFPAATGG